MTYATHHLTTLATDRLRKGKAGDTIPVTEWESLLKVSCSAGDEGKLRIRKAVSICWKRHRILWRWDRDGKVLECCGAEAVLTELEKEKKRSRKSSDRLLGKSLCVEVDSLNETQRKQYLSLQVQGQIGSKVNSNAATEALRESGVERFTVPDLAKLLAMMKK